MDLRLQFLESLKATGSDGHQYKVRAYDRLTTDPSFGPDHWESTGQVEYRLDDGRFVEMGPGGQMRIAGTSVTLDTGSPVRPGPGEPGQRLAERQPA